MYLTEVSIRAGTPSAGTADVVTGADHSQKWQYVCSLQQADDFTLDS